MKKCPYCAEQIQDEAIKCRYCLSWLVEEVPAGAERPPAAPLALAAPLAPAAQPAGPKEPEAMIPIAPTAAPSTEPPTEQITFTHSGERYLLGYGANYFGIWDRQAPAVAAFRFPRNDPGWRDAWTKYVSIESNFIEVK